MDRRRDPADAACLTPVASAFRQPLDAGILSDGSASDISSASSPRFSVIATRIIDMPVPTYDKFIEPILRYLATHPDGAVARDVHDAAAQALRLNEAERAELLPSGAQHVFKNRAGWGHDRLKRAGLSTRSRRGYWQLTEAGRAFAHDHPPPLPENVLETIAVWNGDVRLRPGAAVSAESSTAPTAIADRGTVSPDDRLEQALSELRQGVVAELVDVLLQVSPEYFETIVLDLLHKMRYGTSRADLIRVGRSGDGGIDGIICGGFRTRLSAEWPAMAASRASRSTQKEVSRMRRRRWTCGRLW